MRHVELFAALLAFLLLGDVVTILYLAISTQSVPAGLLTLAGTLIAALAGLYAVPPTTIRPRS